MSEGTQITQTNQTASQASTDLAKIAEALNTLAKYAYLYGGPRTRPRRIVEVVAGATLRIKYDDGSTQYIDPRMPRRFMLYISKPKRA